MTFAGDAEAGERALAPVPGARDAHRRPAPADALRRDVPARGPRLPPDRRRPDVLPRPRRSTTLPRRSSTGSRSTCGPRRPDGASPSSGSSAARWRACPPTRRRSPTASSRIMVNRRRARRVGRGAAAAPGVGRIVVAAISRRRDPGAYVNFVARRGPSAIRDAYPGATWDRLVGDQGPLRPDEPVPPQPERRPVGTLIEDRRQLPGPLAAAARSARRCPTIVAT